MHPLFHERRYLIPFRSALLPQIFTDVLVIGAGVAGMRAALAASEHSDVIIACKGSAMDSNTAVAQGGIAAVIDQHSDPPPTDGDSFDSHIQDTIKAGGDLCDRQVVDQVVRGAPARVAELIDWGMQLDCSDDQRAHLALGREGGHAHHRILHADGDATGRVLAATLNHEVGRRDNIRFFADCFVLDLITTGDPPHTTGRCIGAITHHPRYGLQVIWAGATILAAGGCGQVYRETTNPQVATGDGLAMAYRAGAQLADMAFVQFHPTTLYIAGASRSLISEAVRGEGAYLLDCNGHRFMPDYDSRAELTPRDIVSRAILCQIAQTSSTHAFLDCRHIGTESFAHRFPKIYATLRQFDIDPGQDAIPVYPSAHYMIGGVWTDAHSRTSVPGLYACGEAAYTGMHGANRLASNSLLEGLVLGEVAGRTCREVVHSAATDERPADADPNAQPHTPPGGIGPMKIVSDIRPSNRSQLDILDVRSSLRSMMWRHVGIERTGARLTEVADMLDFWASYTLDKIFDDQQAWEVQNLLLVAALITQAASWRQESRGTHFRLDYPDPREKFHCHDVWPPGRAEPDRITPHPD